MFFSRQTAARSCIQRRLVACLCELRNSKQAEWETEATPEKQGDDNLEFLGSEHSSDSRLRAPPPKRLTPERKAALRKQFSYVTVDFPFGDEVVHMRVLTVAAPHEQPTVEASIANFRAMFCWCRLEAARREGAPLEARPVAREQPRSIAEGRGYYRKDRNCYYLLRDKKKLGGDSGGARTQVSIKRVLGRSRSKPACAADVDQPSSFAGGSSSTAEASASSESIPWFSEAACPNDQASAEF